MSPNPFGIAIVAPNYLRHRSVPMGDWEGSLRRQTFMNEDDALNDQAQRREAVLGMVPIAHQQDKT
jgi:hypothetical protein